jgi:hypothetical protein
LTSTVTVVAKNQRPQELEKQLAVLKMVPGEVLKDSAVWLYNANPGWQCFKLVAERHGHLKMGMAQLELSQLKRKEGQMY